MSSLELVASGLEFALGEINRRITAFANMGFVEFVGKDLLFLSTIRALAGKGREILVCLQTGTVQWCTIHSMTPFS
jgi:hypothetical protein